MNRWLITIVPLFLFVIIGCNGNTKNTVSPSTNPMQPAPAGYDAPGGNQYLLGYYDVHFDIESETFEIVENRNVSFTLNIVPLLNKMLIPKYGITFGSVVIHDDDPNVLGVDVEFTVHHPFPGYQQFDAYDMRTVVIGNGAQVLTYDGLKVAEHGTDLWMKNPDGYTRWMNPTEFTSELIFGYTPGGYQNLAGDAQLNPYKYNSKHLQANQNLWSYLTGDLNWDGKFESGSGRTMELEFPLPPGGIGLRFGYAVIVCWEEQGPDGPYYPVHVAEPVAASVTQTADVWYDASQGSGGKLILDIELFAWDSQPSTIMVESTVLENVVSYDAASIGQPVSEHVSTYHIEEIAKPLTSADGHEFWVIAVCDAYDYSNGLQFPHADGSLAAFFRYDAYVGTSPENNPPTCNLTADPDVDYGGVLPVTITFDSNGSDPDPGDVLSYEWSENGIDWVPGGSTYQVEYTIEGTYSIYVRVIDNYGATTECSIIDFIVSAGPKAVASACTCLWIAPGETVTFSGAESFTANTQIISYEWDFDGDNIFGDSYLSGTDENPTVQYDTVGVYNVNLRVTDDMGFTDELDPAEILDVHVGSWSPPTAVANIIPTIGFTGVNFAGDFEGSGSNGSIDLYEWDFEGDCVWDYEHATIGDTTHAYTIPGLYDAVFRVTGTGCDSVSTPVRMIEPFGILGNGNFWDGVTWTPWTHGHWNKPGPLVEEIIPDPTFRNIIRFYSSPTSDGNCTWIIQDVDYDVSDLSSLYFNFFFYVDHNTLTGDGWLGGDPDMLAKVGYEDVLGDYYEVWYCYDTSFDGTWQWDIDVPPPFGLPDYVVYHEQEVVDAQVWNERKTIDLMTLDPTPQKITRAKISSRGWSWESFTILPWFSTD